jgi:predicted nucleic acid-binding protein
LTWCFGDEATQATDDLLLRLMDEGAYAPSLLPMEMLNVLLMAQRRGRITQETRRNCLAFLHALPIMLDARTVSQAWAVSNLLAERYTLTIYDAVYLELAQRLDLPLATLDADLRKAAKALGVSLLGAAEDSGE